MDTQKKIINELWIEKKISNIKVGGFWYWLDEGHIYYLLPNLKLRPQTEEGKLDLLKIVRPIWFKNHIVYK